MGRAPQDYDVATSATPPRSARSSERAGRWPWESFGVIIVKDRPGQGTSRSPPSAAKVPTATPAAPTTSSTPLRRRTPIRRDFTVNGMFYDPIDGR